MKPNKKPDESVTPTANGPSVFPQVAETVTVTRETLDATPGKVLMFLRSVGTLAAVRDALRKRGYSLSEHTRGWRLLHRVSGFAEGTSPQGDGGVSQALAELEAWDAPNLTLADAALKHRHPEQHTYVFGDLRPARSAAPVLVMRRFLDRLDALDGSPDREATRAADRAAMATLASRGITASERARVRGLLAKIETLSDVVVDEDTTLTTPAEMDLSLRSLRAFYEEWSAVAKIAVTRRDYLIRMGLASPRKRKDAAPAPIA